MKQKILADTSVWIEYFRGNDEMTSFVEENLFEGKIYINGIVLAEIIQGIKSEKKSNELSSSISSIPYIDIAMSDWSLAGKISRDLRKNGITIPLTDIGLAATAINNDLLIATYDNHFKYIPDIDLLFFEKDP